MMRKPKLYRIAKKLTIESTENKISTCVCMNVAAKESNAWAHTILVDISFSDAWCNHSPKVAGTSIATIRFKYGIKEGQLIFDLKNLESKVESRWVRSGRIDYNIEKEYTTTFEYESGITENSGLEAGVEKSVPSGKIKAARDEKNISKHGSTEKMKTNHFQITEIGDVNSPQWNFCVKDAKTCLQGRFSEHIADFDVIKYPCAFTARFTVPALNSITVIECEINNMMLSQKGLSRTFIIALLRKYLWKNLQSYVSRVEAKA